MQSREAEVWTAPRKSAVLLKTPRATPLIDAASLVNRMFSIRAYHLQPVSCRRRMSIRSKLLFKAAEARFPWRSP